MYSYSYYSQSEPKKIKLTKSQLELLKLLASGMSLKTIAIQTGKQYNNIKKRTQLLYKKFDVHTRRELILKTYKEVLINNKNITKIFRKRFIKNTYKRNTETLKVDLTEREIKLLQLKSKSTKQKEMIEQLGLWSYYGLKQKEFYICEKFNCSNILEAIFIAKQMEII